MKKFRLKELLPLTLIALHFLILTRIQFIAWPEMFSYPYLLSKGYLLYRDIINPYPPILSYFLHYFYSIFGISLFSLKFISFIIIAITDVILFLIVKKVFNQNIALLTLLIYIFLQPSLEGNGLWFDLVITPLFLLAYYLIYKYNSLRTNNKSVPNIVLVLFLGLVLSFTFLIKQTSIFVILAIGLLIIIRRDKRKLMLAFYSLALIFPILFISYFMFKLGIFRDYLFWVYQYPFQHLKSVGFSLYPTNKQLIILIILLLPVFYAFLRYRSDKKILITNFLLMPSLLFSLPRFSYFHLQPALPFIAIISTYVLGKLQTKRLIAVSVYLLCLTAIFAYFFIKNINKEPRFYDKETIKISSLLKNKLMGNTSLFFYNVTSEYFVIANLLPLKPWADTFPWYLETSGIQEKIITSLTTQNVSYVVFRPFANEDLYTPGTYKPLKINQYIEKNYLIDEKIDKNIWILRKK